MNVSIPKSSAVQILCTINGQSISIEKKHLISLNIKRVIGDSANEFTLEVFDETAWRLENAIMANSAGESLPPISITYSNANNIKNAITFIGNCLSYQLSFVGRATVLSISGVLSASAVTQVSGTNFWFDRRTIEWVGGMTYQTSGYDKDGVWQEGTGSIDGKSEYEWANYANNEDVCAILVWPTKTDDNGKKVPDRTQPPTPYYNPTRIFKRIIHLYNGDKLGSENYVVSASTNTTIQGTSSSAGVNKTNTTDTIYRYFMNKKFTLASTCGILGNMMRESGVDPSRVQYGYSSSTTVGGIGLCQWSGSRNVKLRNKAAAKGVAWSDLITQLDLAYSEMQSYGMIDRMKSETNVESATKYFEQMFEKAGVVAMNDRIRYAKGFAAIYSSYKETVITTTVSKSRAVTGWGTGGNKGFVLGDCDESRWIKGDPSSSFLTQQNETAAQFITRELCKIAVTNKHAKYEDETAGFKYYVDAKGHHFKAINYDNSASKVEITYGMQNSKIISFSVSGQDTYALTGTNKDPNGKVLIDTSALDALTGEIITAEGENVLQVADDGTFQQVTSDSDLQEQSHKNINWWYNQWGTENSVQRVKISSSASTSYLKANLSSTWEAMKNYSYSAELTVWADFNNVFIPGNFIDIIVTGNGKQQHYSSGIYMILNITDNISADGYTQTLKLFKMQNSYNKSSSSGSAVNGILLDAYGNQYNASKTETSSKSTDYVTSYTIAPKASEASNNQNVSNTNKTNNRKTSTGHSWDNLNIGLYNGK